MNIPRPRLGPSVLATTGLAVLTTAAIGMRLGGSPSPAVGNDGYAAFAFNDLGMHCMNDDFSEICILPPYNTLRVQVLKRDSSPDIVDENVTVTYVVPSNTHSADKTNFWDHAEALFGVNLPPDVGLAGKGMTGTLDPTPSKLFEAVGIPITPILDSGRYDPYPVAEVRVNGEEGSFTCRPVVPVSSEMSCSLCHGAPGLTVAGDILQDHDELHGTSLQSQTPVLCANCHADVALGAPGDPDLPSLSQAMHGAHADRVEKLGLANNCYACHPGLRTECQRDIHLANEVECIDCHGGMKAVADPNRMPWVDQPRCGDCHDRPGFEFEQPGVLFKDAIGHGEVHCAACHGSPHAITPTVTAVDNQQAIALQGHPGVIDSCTVCHTEMPDESFFHRVEKDDD